MKQQPQAQQPGYRSQQWDIAVGDHAPEGLTHSQIQRVWMRVWLDGPNVGKIDLRDYRVHATPIQLNPAQAERLAAQYDHETCPGEQRVEAALLDAAHLARQAAGVTTSRRKPGRL